LNRLASPSSSLRDYSQAANCPNNTDEGHAQRLLRAVKGRCHFVAEWGKFIFYDGKQWKVDIGGVQLLAETTAVTKQLCSEAAALDDDLKAERKRLIDEAKQSEGLRFKTNSTALLKAQQGIAISATTLDTHHMYLPVANGIVDLENMTLGQHDPSSLNTNCLPWLYDAASACPRWMKFLEEVLPDADTVAFVQRLVGYFLTGSTCEQVLAFCYGSGSNGKTVFVRILQDLLGPFAIQCPTGMLIEARHERPTTDQADLRGKRLGVCAETPSGMYWNEPLVKQLTGSDRMKARRLYQDFEEFEPTHKLIVCGNYKPRVRGQDLGIWRRIRLIPFERTFAEQDRDPRLMERLRAEMSGILAWAVEGCVLWQRDGLGTSAKVKGATSDYRQESDVLAQFVAECCAVGTANVVSRAALYHAFAGWMQAQGDQHYPRQKGFAELVRGHGYDECWRTINGSKARCWLGIGLLDPAGCTKESYSAKLPPDSSHEGDFVEKGVPSVVWGGQWEAIKTGEEAGAKKQGNPALQSVPDMGPPTVEEKDDQWLALAGKTERLVAFERGRVNSGELSAELGDREQEQSVAR
jgi:putative DNA primase/helicase